MAVLERRTAAVRNGSVRYYAGGSGDPFVLLHGLGGSAGNWAELVAPLAERCRLLVVDLPGHGGTAALPRGAGMSDFAGVVAEVLTAESIDRAYIGGHSFGGLVALRLAQQRPELVRGLLLGAPAGIASGTRFARAAVLASTRLRPGRWVAPFRFRWADSVWYRRAIFRPWFVSDAEPFSAAATHALLAGIDEHADVAIAGRAMVDDDPRVDLEAVRCPVMLLWGARDTQLPLDDAFEYARRLRAKLRVVADCGHLVPLERPGAWLDAFDDLRRLA